MPPWTPALEWKDQDAFILGGGPSLSGFNFEGLEGRNTIGCNDAFRLGSKIVQFCLFGDTSFFHRNKWDLENFGGRVVTCAPSLSSFHVPWLLQMSRIRDGIHTGSTLGWNYSTGAAAVNLAISLGAVRIFLLGFDMTRRKDGRSHWHTYALKPVQDESYRRFIRGFGNVEKDLAKFPRVKVLNVTNGSSQLPYFRRVSFEVFWKWIPIRERPDCEACKERKREALAV